MKRLIICAFVIIFTLVFALNICASETAVQSNDINEQVTVTDQEQQGIIDTIMNSTIWVSIGTYASLALGILVFVHKKFGSISSLIKSKADTETVIKGVSAIVEDSIAEIRAQLAESQTKLASAEDNEKKLTTILCMYIMNDTRYNANAKAEIMKYISGIKSFSGSVIEICETATAEIEKLNEAEQKESTPVLDEILSEVNSGLAIALD